MNTRISVIFSKSILSMVIILILVVWPSNLKLVRASNSVPATNSRLNGRSAFFVFEEGDRYTSLTVTRDDIENTTSLYFGYRFPDPNDSNQTIYITGDPGEIPNSAFTVNSTSAELKLTTPDTYPITRCIVNNETGEFTCAPTGPSTFDLIWIEDNSWTFQGSFTRLEISDSTMARSRGRFGEVKASVRGTWDEFSGMNMTGYLTNSDNATLFREKMMEANLLLFSPLTWQAPVEATHSLTDKVHINEAFTFLDSGDGGGLVRVWQDEITDTTTLRFGYVFRDPDDPSRVLFYEGIGQIPNNAFSINSASAELRVTTLDNFPITHCIITGVVGDPGGFICYPYASSIIFDLIWSRDGSGSVHEVSSNVLTEGSTTTRFHGEYNEFNAPASGTWKDVYQHAGTDMTGFLFNIQNITTDKVSP